MGADADAGHDRGAQAPDIGVGDAIERPAEAVGANLRPEIGARAAARVEEPRRRVAGGNVERGQQ